ncbi:MAG: dephospho-CoA kinase [Phycisphaeraceae bacterium]|nr:dephospho-CoA kinase [Phycisphaerae bacterium]MBX3393449.1 dephospho-CoA kinase [Phycisphaeraceae bacterium]HRJ49660.1 dephospho-CoA kinase [Phycisphaerales bacterium]
MTTTDREDRSVPIAASPDGPRGSFSIRPSPWFIVLRHAWWYAAMLLVLVVIWSAGRALLQDLRGLFLGLWWLAFLFRLVWDFLEWLNRRYTLTGDRISRHSGVLRRSLVEIPLRNIQYLALDRSVRQRLTGVGSLAAGTSALLVPEVVWNDIPVPRRYFDDVRGAVLAAGGNPSGLPGLAAPGAANAAAGRVIQVGVAGGIGSGKSAVAGVMRDLGCHVSDSDAEARRLLDTPEIRDELTRWWGSSILGSSGWPDRSKIAEIIFSDASERARLESLLHPLIKQARDRLVSRVREAGGGVVVVDAPLLFESGIDRDCDAVVFVEASDDVRAGRLSSRRWSPEHLSARQAAQLPLDQKRARSTHIIRNDGDLAHLRRSVESLLKAIVASGSGGRTALSAGDRESR